MKEREVTMKELFRCFQYICETERFVYSPEQAAKMIETDLEALKKWALKNISCWQRDMHRCRYYCALNIGRALGKGELTEEEAKKHLRNLGYGVKWSMASSEADNVWQELKLRADLKDAEKESKAQ